MQFLSPSMSLTSPGRGLHPFQAGIDKVETNTGELIEKWQEKSSELVEDFSRFFDRVSESITRAAGMSP